MFSTLLCIVAVHEADGLIVSPHVQLGDRVANGRNSFAIVWQAKDQADSFSLMYQVGRKTLVAAVHSKRVNIGSVEAHRVYSATIKGYSPGKRVSYKLVSGRRVIYQNQVMAPKSDRQAFSFGVFGDSGCGKPAQAAIAYQTLKLHPDLLLLTGDLVYDNGRITEYRKNFYPAYTVKPASAAQGADILGSMISVAAPGNHDILNRQLDRYPDGLAYFYYWDQPLNGPIGRVGHPSSPTLSGTDGAKNALLAGAGSKYPRMANFSFDYGNAHFVALDANPYVNWKDPELRSWLKRDLARASAKVWRFVMLHQPGFHSSDSHQSEKQMRQVAALFEDGKVDVVFCGHVHNYQRSYPIRVGYKRGAEMDLLARNNWDVDREYDGKRIFKPKGVIYVVDGAGGNGLYNPDLEGRKDKWKPFTANYLAKHSLSYVGINGRTFLLRQIDHQGREIDRFKIKK